MPRWASRLTLIVTATRIERLWAITEAGAEAEGAPGEEFSLLSNGILDRDWPNWRIMQPSYQAGYANLWAKINGLASWQANPWVVVVQFQVKRANIDKLGDSADGRPEQEAGGQRPEPVRAEP